MAVVIEHSGGRVEISHGEIRLDGRAYPMEELCMVASVGATAAPALHVEAAWRE